MNRILVLIPVLALLISGGCARSLDVNTRAVERERLDLPSPFTPEIREYRIYVVTEDNAQEVFEKLRREGVDPVLFALTDRGYETKSINDRKVVNYIIELRTILEEYREYYENDR